MPDMPMSRETPAAADPSDQRLRNTARGAADWRPLLRALVEELDTLVGTDGRDSLLRGVGRQLAQQYPLTPQNSTEGLALEMNEVLESFGWGRVAIRFSTTDACLYLSHEALPLLGGRGNPPGTWLASTMVGLYEAWLGQQPGTDPTFAATRAPSEEPGIILIRYGRG